MNSNLIMQTRTLNILLADDDQDDRDLFTEAVHEAKENIRCITLENGEQAISYLNDPNNEPPDYIFLDLRMPRMSGRQCLEIIRQQPRLMNIPVIIYTTSDDVEDSRDLAEMGATHFVTKPTNPEEIYYILSMILNEKWI